MSFLDGMIRQREYNRWLESMERERAVDLNKSECQRCGYCCAVRPCIPTPNELKEIAKFLDMDLKKCIKTYFVVDRLWLHEEYYIFPAKKCQKDVTGEYLESERTFDKGYCIFYDEKKKECRIYSVRPIMARNTACWIDNGKCQTDEALKSWKEVDFSEFLEQETINRIKYEFDLIF